MKVTVTTHLYAPAEKVWSLAKQSETLHFVAKGLMSFKSLNGSFPTQWQPGKTELARIILFGVIPAWKHKIHFKEVSDSNMSSMTQEAGGLITTWDHSTRVKPIDTQRCEYTDVVEIQAGLLTPIIWLYANLFYRYRQKRWHRWVLMNE